MGCLMGVRRTALEFEDHYTQIPNGWMRDVRLSRRARGVLAEIMTHRVGWHVSVSGLVKTGPEGRDAIRTALVELKDAGYLEVSQTRGTGGRWNEVEYELRDPSTADGFSVTGGFTGAGSTASGESATKKNISKEEHLEEDARSSSEGFAEFYLTYPRKVGKEGARRAFAKAVRSTEPGVIIAGARRFAADPNLPEKQFIPHPATWLNQGRWDDEPLPPRAGQHQPDSDEFGQDEWMYRS